MTYVWECVAEFETNNPLHPRAEQVLRERGRGLERLGEQLYRWPTRVHAPDAVTATSNLERMLCGAFESVRLDSHDYFLTRTSAARQAPGDN